MDSWFQKARDFAQEAAKKSQELAKEAAKLSQEIAVETAKKSKEIAEEATKKADQIKIEAAKKADQLKTEAFKSLAGENPPSAPKKSSAPPQPEDLQTYGVTDELREFVKGLTLDTFKDFPLDNSALEENQPQPASPSPNVRQDLTKWQERHAVHVLSIVPEISHFRYVLCPRHMKESKFWKIYFLLVKSHVAPYEKAYMQQLKAATAEQEKSIRLQENSGTASSEVEMIASSGSTKAKVVPSENDIDAFLLGDIGSSDEDGDEGDDIFDDDFNNIVNSTNLDSEDEEAMTSDKPKKSEKMVTKPSASDGSSDGELVEVPAEH
uniref:BSD domain-containing protein n=1 Tax=Araucaria cunninghamii TaxID=56994 RepID=A0A0D6QXQ9_ARACU